MGGPCQQDIEVDTFARSFKAQVELMGKTGEKLVKEHREQCARTLMSCGLTLIPSDVLQDHQYVVSRGVFDAAKRIADGRA